MHLDVYEPTCIKLCVLSVSVTQLAWFDEDSKFAVAYQDGEVMLCGKNEYEEPIKVEAHQVRQSLFKYSTVSAVLFGLFFSLSSFLSLMAL